MDVEGRIASGTAIEDAKAEVIGTTPWMGDDSREGGGRERPEHVLEVELRREQQPRATQEAKAEHFLESKLV